MTIIIVFVQHVISRHENPRAFLFQLSRLIKFYLFRKGLDRFQTPTSITDLCASLTESEKSQALRATSSPPRAVLLSFSPTLPPWNWVPETNQRLQHTERRRRCEVRKSRDRKQVFIDHKRLFYYTAVPALNRDLSWINRPIILDFDGTVALDSWLIPATSVCSLYGFPDRR